LNSGGFVEEYGVLLPGGTNQLMASYPGDNSYGSSSGSYALTVTPVATQISIPSLGGLNIIGNPIYMESGVTASVYSGAAPTGTITFYDGSTVIPGTVTLGGQAGTATTDPSFGGSLNVNFTTAGTHQMTAKYSGDANYAAAISGVVSLVEFYSSTVSEQANPTTINLGQSVSVTATVTGGSKTPPMTGTFQFYPSAGDPAIGSPATLTQGTDVNGNQTLTATVVTTPPQSDALQLNYSGDLNYASSTGVVYINVVIPDFSMATAAPSLTTTDGQTGSTLLTVTPLSSVSSMVALTCDVSSMVGASCSFKPTSPVSLVNGAAATTTFSVATVPPSSSPTTSFLPIRSPKTRQPLPVGGPLLAVADGLVLLVWIFSDLRNKLRWVASLGMAGMLCLVLSCGSSSASGGGGNSTSTPTSVTLTTSSLKVAAGATFTLTATVHSTQQATGTVVFIDPSLAVDVGGAFAGAALVDGIATAQVSLPQVGTHTISAKYIGDTNNEASKTNGAINEAVTGTAPIFIYATTSALQRSLASSITIQ
jgi:hypothetical protein